MRNAKLTKQEFVAQFPETMPTGDIVTKAKAAGLSIKANHVSTIRWQLRRMKPTPKPARIAVHHRPKASKREPGAQRTPSKLASLKQLMAEIGLIQSRAALDELAQTAV